MEIILATKTVEAYKNIIDEEIQLISCSTKWCSLISILNPTSASIILNAINREPKDNIIAVMQRHNLIDKLINVYLIHAITKLTLVYINESQATIFNNRQHKEQITKIHQILLRTQSSLNINQQWRTYPTTSINQIISLFQAGVLRSQCNPNGNFANICRALIIKTRGLSDWRYDDSFLRALGLYSFNPSPINLIYRKPMTAPNLTRQRIAIVPSALDEPLRIIHRPRRLAEIRPTNFNAQRHRLWRQDTGMSAVARSTDTLTPDPGFRHISPNISNSHTVKFVPRPPSFTASRPTFFSPRIETMKNKVSVAVNSGPSSLESEVSGIYNFKAIPIASDVKVKFKAE